MKRRKIKQAGQHSVEACVERLQALIDGLKAGNLILPDGAEPVALTPGGVVGFELRIDQLQRRETLRVEMTWCPEALRPQSERSAPLPSRASEAEQPPAPLAPVVSVPPRLPDDLEEDEPMGPLSTRSLDRLATKEYQRLYEAARIVGNDGQWHIDQDQLIVSLALAGVDPLTQQELYALALQADADGRASMLSERVIEAIKRVSQHPPSLSG